MESVLAELGFLPSLPRSGEGTTRVDRSKRIAFVLIAVMAGLIVALIIVLLLVLGGPVGAIAAAGVGSFAGISGLILGIMAACGMFSPPPKKK